MVNLTTILMRSHYSILLHLNCAIAHISITNYSFTKDLIFSPDGETYIIWWHYEEQFVHMKKQNVFECFSVYCPDNKTLVHYQKMDIVFMSIIIKYQRWIKLVIIGIKTSLFVALICITQNQHMTIINVGQSIVMYHDNILS
jgi:hypothetical protein